jgi:hypothetical protein
MRIDPAIAALRADRGLQRRAQLATSGATEAWRSEPAAATVLADLARFGAGAPLAGCPALERLFAGGVEAQRLATTFCRRRARVLSDEPFGHPPLRHGFDGTVSTLLLPRAGRAQLILHAREPGQAELSSVSFSDAERFEAVLAGEAEARIERGTGGRLVGEAMVLRKGVRLALDLSNEALRVTAVRRRLVSLRLHRTAAEPRATREVSLADGALVHRSSGDLSASRHQMMLAVLGRMKCAQAAPIMAAMARAPGEPSLRWQALREGLALDTALGFAALLAIARSADDALCAAAGALRAQLVEAHPQLRALEGDACPA